MSLFTPGLELSRCFYFEAVRPLLDEHFPNLPYAAALIGPGSEVLGFDNEMSMDHNWYPRLLIFLQPQGAALREPLNEMLSCNLPHAFHGFPADAAMIASDPDTYTMVQKTEGPVDHQVSLLTLRSFVYDHLAWDIDQPLQLADWLTFPPQVLGEITSGAVYYDGVGELTALRQQLDWYPYDIWLYLLAAGWQCISEEEHLMPRAGFVGDETGSAVIGARLVQDVMRLCFLMEKQYAPYPKWFGTAFKKLRCAADLAPVLWKTLQSSNWQERGSALGEAYEYLAHMHNSLGITRQLSATVTNFYSRPFQVIHGGVFASAIQERIADPEVAQIAARGLIGGIDQFSDSTQLRSNMEVWRQALRALYTGNEQD
jgi:hypothetical protein